MKMTVDDINLCEMAAAMKSAAEFMREFGRGRDPQRHSLVDKSRYCQRDDTPSSRHPSRVERTGEGWALPLNEYLNANAEEIRRLREEQRVSLSNLSTLYRCDSKRMAEFCRGGYHLEPRNTTAR